MRVGNILKDSRFTSEKTLLWIIVAFFSSFYLYLAFSNHHCGTTFGWDYGLYNQTFWKYSHLKLNNTIFDPELGNFLQDHFSLTIFFFVPVYWLLGSWLTGSYTLLLLQAAFVSIGALGTYKWVRLKTGNPWLSIASLAHFFTMQGVLSSFAHDYHDIVVASCAMPFFMYFAESKQLWKALACLFFIITSKENMPVVMLAVAATLFISGWKDRQARKHNLIYATVCLSYLLLLFGLFIPLVSDPARKSWVFKYYKLGDSFPQAAWYLLSHPAEATKLLLVNNSGASLYDGDKLRLLIAVFCCWGGIVLLARPEYLLVVVPLICQKVYSDNPNMWGLYIYYSIELCCFMAGTVYICLASIKLRPRFLKYAAVLVFLANIAFTAHWVRVGYRINWLARNEKLNPFKQDICTCGRFNSASTVSGIVPGDASVSCTQRFLPYLSMRDKIASFPTVRDYDYLVLDTLDSYPFDVRFLNEQKLKALSSGNWNMVYQDGAVQVFARGTAR